MAVRRSDGKHIAIQCKARKLDEHGNGRAIDQGRHSQTRKHVFWAVLGRALVGDERKRYH